MTKRTVISVRFSAAELERIEQAAAQQGLERSTFVRRAAIIQAGLDMDDQTFTLVEISEAFEELHDELDSMLAQVLDARFEAATEHFRREQ